MQGLTLNHVSKGDTYVYVGLVQTEGELTTVNTNYIGVQINQ